MTIRTQHASVGEDHQLQLCAYSGSELYQFQDIIEFTEKMNVTSFYIDRYLYLMPEYPLDNRALTTLVPIHNTYTTSKILHRLDITYNGCKIKNFPSADKS